MRLDRARRVRGLTAVFTAALLAPIALLTLPPVVTDLTIALGLLVLYWLVGRASPGHQLLINAISMLVLITQWLTRPESRTIFLGALILVMLAHTLLVVEAFVQARSRPG